jgi:hypothetical protein
VDDRNTKLEALLAAADQGDAEAQFQLGVMYCRSDGVPQDLAQATSWYLRAAEQGHRYAQYNIAVMLLQGQGISQDQAAAFLWSAQAAAQGVPEAEALQGDLHAAGLGTTPDRDSARRWYAKAAAHGNALGARRLRALDEANRRNFAAANTTAVAGRARQRRSGSIAIITMAYNERLNLPIWLRHYRRMAPAATLIVIDHGSDDGSTDDLPGVTRIPLPRGDVDERDRVYLVNSLQHGLLKYYETVIYADCDELLVPDPAIAARLEDYLGQQPYAYASPIGLNIIHMVDAEPRLDFAQPLLRQRRHAQFHSALCKPVVTRVPLNWEPGFHTSERPFNVDGGLYLFHTKQIDRDRALQRQQITRQLAWSKAAIDGRHSPHHRFADEQFLREFFLDPANLLREQGLQPFGFDREIARLLEEAREISGTFHVPAFTGPIVEIPERFRDAF